MPRARLNDRFLRLLKTDKKQQEFADEGFSDGSFGVRVSNSGHKSFVLRYRVQGRRRRVSLGTYPATSLAEARAKARTLLAQVQAGDDPVQVQSEQAQQSSVLWTCRNCSAPS